MSPWTLLSLPLWLTQLPPACTKKGVEDVAVNLALKIHRAGGKYILDCQRLLSGMGRRFTAAQVIAAAVEQGRLQFDGVRVTPGTLNDPELILSSIAVSIAA